MVCTSRVHAVPRWGVDMKGTEQIICFGPFEFNVESLELRRDGRAVHLQQQPAQVLALLLRSHGRLVTRELLRGEIWEGRVIEFDLGLNFCIRQVRKALGDDATSPTYIETVKKRGYRFIAPVLPKRRRAPAHRSHSRARFAAVGLVVALAIGWVAARRGPASFVDEPLTVAVLPFAGIGEDDALQFFSRGLEEDLITELAMLSPNRLRVITN